MIFFVLLLALCCPIAREAACSPDTKGLTAGAQKSLFYEQYLMKYYPRALVVRSHFLAEISPADVDRLLDDVVTIFKTDPVAYFVNDSSRSKIGIYWETVVDQLSLISEFIKKAYVDLETNKIFLLEPLLFGVGCSQFNCTFVRDAKNLKTPMKLLLAFMKEKRYSGYVRFYATYFDYLVKLFNEGVLFKNLPQAQRYQHELEFVMTKLRGTEFERKYEDPLKVCKELMIILQEQVLAANDDEDADDAVVGDRADNSFDKPTRSA